MDPELEENFLREARDARLWTALSHPARRTTLEWLDVGPAPATDLGASISARFGVGRSRASQHLRALADAGLVRVTADGPERWYWGAEAAADPLVVWLRDRGLISGSGADR